MKRDLPAQPSVRSTVPPSPVAPLRLQAAVVRALLDELDEHAPTSDVSAITEQLAEELERLGRDALRASNAIGRALASTRPAARQEAAEDEPRIPHWLPLVAF
jgi:hypothetical protein